MDSFLIILQARAVKAREAFYSASAEYEALFDGASEEGLRALISACGDARREVVFAATAAAMAFEEAADEFADAKRHRELLQAAYLLGAEAYDLDPSPKIEALLERLTEALADLPM